MKKYISKYCYFAELVDRQGTYWGAPGECFERTTDFEEGEVATLKNIQFNFDIRITNDMLNILFKEVV
ncbi:hypothetical protein [Culicoidibacter larvae]|uniref:Uncharacterized protein n=1 Tax=Culicoidibacter larvae TaxID=2579976 RepID=A0A5R8Q7J4_9FIRM|nr:hypothetical protein [Culicoidibacter larvae]TLG70267.1 hypothetical protein FEZ08_12015 [Culicoidibacter larvae]